MLAGEVREAITTQFEAVSADPTAAAPRRSLGTLYLANGMAPSAAVAFQQSITLGDDSAVTYYLLGTALEMSGDLDQALTAMAQGRDLDPISRQLCWRPGFWLLEDGQAAQALELFERAGMLEQQTGRPQPDGAAWRIGKARALMDLDRPAEAIPVLEELSTLLNHFYVDYLLTQARRRAGITTETVGTTNAAAVEPPSYPDPWWDQVSAAQRGLDGRMARIDELLSQARLADAKLAINEARVIWPKDVNLMNRQSELHRRQGDTKAWVRTLKQAIRTEPTHAASHYNLSVAYQQTGELDAALNHAYQAVAANETMANGWLQVGRLTILTSRFDQTDPAAQQEAMDAALVPLDRAFALGVEAPSDHLMYGHVLLLANRLDDAQRILEQLTQRPNGGSPQAWVRLSEVFSAQGDHQSALKTALLGLNRFPKEPLLIQIVDRYRRGRPNSADPAS